MPGDPKDILSGYTDSERNLVTFVCTANICRSPMAEKLLEHALQAEGPPLSDLEVISTGVAAYHGDRASENSVIAVEKVGLDLTGHQSQPITQDIMDRSLAVFCMTTSHRVFLESHFKPHRSIHLIREFLPKESGNEIPDPFGQSLAAYEACRDSIVEAIPSIVDFLKKQVDARV